MSCASIALARFAADSDFDRLLSSACSYERIGRSYRLFWDDGSIAVVPAF